MTETYGAPTLVPPLSRDWNAVRKLAREWELRREQDTIALRLVVQGYDQATIARHLNVGFHTVNHMLERMRRNLNLSNTQELAAWAGEHGFREGASSDRPTEPQE